MNRTTGKENDTGYACFAQKSIPLKHTQRDTTFWTAKLNKEDYQTKTFSHLKGDNPGKLMNEDLIFKRIDVADVKNTTAVRCSRRGWYTGRSHQNSQGRKKSLL